MSLLIPAHIPTGPGRMWATVTVPLVPPLPPVDHIPARKGQDRPASHAAKPGPARGTCGAGWQGVTVGPCRAPCWGAQTSCSLTSTCQAGLPRAATQLLPGASGSPHGAKGSRPGQDLPQALTPQARCSTVSSSPWPRGDNHMPLTGGAVRGRTSKPQPCAPDGEGVGDRGGFGDPLPLTAEPTRAAPGS